MNKKIAYKIELLYIKYIPMLISLCLAINSILCYFNIYILSKLGGIIFGVSIFYIIHLYISSIAYKFCKYHRMFIHYIAVNYTINIFDYFIGIPISVHNLFYINVFIIVVFLFLILYFYLQSKKYGNDRDYKEIIIESCGRYGCWELEYYRRGRGRDY